MAKNKIIPYRRDLKAKARALRKNGTLGEVLLWQRIKNGQLLGYQFHRQVPMLDYIVDFYCHELSLVIEVDGESHFHDDAPKRDAIRQQRLESHDVQFLRFHDRDVKRQLVMVVDTITDWIEKHSSE